MSEAELDEGQRTSGKSAAAFRTISEVSAELNVPQHVLRFWETKFTQLRPLKRGGGRRYYRPQDVELLRRIHGLLYAEGYTIKGVQRLLRAPKGAAEQPDAPAVEHHADEANADVRTPGMLVPDVDTGAADEREDGDDRLSLRQREELESILQELHDLRRMLRDSATG